VARVGKALHEVFDDGVFAVKASFILALAHLRGAVGEVVLDATVNALVWPLMPTNLTCALGLYLG